MNGSQIENREFKIRFRIKKHQPITSSFFATQENRYQHGQVPKENMIQECQIETELTAEQRSILKKWIDRNLSIINTINKKNTVLEMIDLFDKTVNPDFDISTIDFAECMLESGFKMNDGFFNVSSVSIKKLYKIVEKMDRIIYDSRIPVIATSRYL